MFDNYYCFPDIHGEYKLLRQALDFVYAANPLGGKIIFLGDYIDRGPENKKVLETVMNPPKNWEFVCCRGNHEEIFLQEYLEGGDMFYDMNVLYEFYADGAFVNKEYKKYIDLQELIDSFPGTIVEWMKKLKLFHFEDNNVFAHAFYDYTRKPEEQLESECLWRRMDDFEAFHSEGNRLHLTHGHTSRKKGPIQSTNRTNLDCGAAFYGRFVIAEYEKNVTGPIRFHEFERK